MKTIKRIASLLLAFSLVVIPAMINADDMKKHMDKDLINGDIKLTDSNVNPVEMEEYITYEGHIVDVNTENKNMSLWVQKVDEKEKFQGGIVFHINEDVLLLSDRTMDKIEKDYFKKDMKVLVFLKTNTPMTMSLPPQATPHKVILLDHRDLDFDFHEDLTVYDKIIIERQSDGNSITDAKPMKVLENKIYRDENRLLMVPLREVGEALGYKVTWDGQKRAVQLTKGGQWTQVVIGQGTVGEDNYNFAKMIVKLGAPPILKDSTTYVPVNFIEEVLQMDISLEHGTIRIKE